MLFLKGKNAYYNLAHGALLLNVMILYMAEDIGPISAIFMLEQARYLFLVSGAIISFLSKCKEEEWLEGVQCVEWTPTIDKSILKGRHVYCFVPPPSRSSPLQLRSLSLFPLTNFPRMRVDSFQIVLFLFKFRNGSRNAIFGFSSTM